MHPGERETAVAAKQRPSIPLAVSLGDPAGVGPEVTARALAPWVGKAVVFGHGPTLQAAVRRWAPAVRLVAVAPGDPLPPDAVGVVSCGPDVSGAIDAPGPEAAAAQVAALDAAVDAVLGGWCAALVTAPMNKHTASLVEPGFTGHTEHLARRCALAADAVTMTFVLDDQVVGLVSTHIPLAEVVRYVTAAHYDRTAHHVADLCAALTDRRPVRIAVPGVNPHCGEGGLLGQEEERVLAPWCRTFARPGVVLEGPMSSETAYRAFFSGAFDGLVAAYHDQALIPLKLSGPGRAVNVTCGLPFWRTSPDHGTAYAIARTGEADPEPMARAMAVAARLGNRR